MLVLRVSEHQARGGCFFKGTSRVNIRRMASGCSKCQSEHVRQEECACHESVIEHKVTIRYVYI